MKSLQLSSCDLCVPRRLRKHLFVMMKEVRCVLSDQHVWPPPLPRWHTRAFPLTVASLKKIFFSFPSLFTSDIERLDADGNSVKITRLDQVWKRIIERNYTKPQTIWRTSCFTFECRHLNTGVCVCVGGCFSSVAEVRKSYKNPGSPEVLCLTGNLSNPKTSVLFCFFKFYFSILIWILR